MESTQASDTAVKLLFMLQFSLMAFAGCSGSATPGYSSALPQWQQNPARLAFQAPQHTPGAANALQNSLLD